MKYSPTPIISYNDFSSKIYDKTVDERIPFDGMLEVTRRCNIKCPYCYASPDASKKELTYKQICHILDEISAAGCLWLTITGGEPLMRRDFLDIYAYARKKGLIITILTNGTLITRKIADYFKKYPPFLLEITLGGITKKTYENISGVPGSFERCLKAIRLLIERNIVLKLKTTVTTLNVHELWQIKKYVEGLGIDFRFDAVLHPAVNGSRKPLKFRVSPEEVAKLDITDQERCSKLKDFYKKAKNPPRLDKLYICGAGINSFHINPYGELCICILSRDSYDLLKGTFKDAWNNFIPKIRNQKLKSDYKCVKCDLSTLCGPCPDWTLLETGEKEKPVDYLCQVAHLRAEAFGFRKGVKKGWQAESNKKELIESRR